MLAYRGIVLGVTGGTTIAPVSDDMVYIGQAYLSPTLGIALGFLLFVVAIYLIFAQRRSRAAHALDVAPMWRDAAKLAGLGVVLAAFVITFNSYEGIPLPVLLFWRCWAFSATSPRRPCSAAACTRWARTWRRPACPVSTSNLSSCGSSGSWA
jgi:ABC-type xylose transport system permease subunit